MKSLVKSGCQTHALLAVSCLLSACGSSGSDINLEQSNTNTNPAGYYTGTRLSAVSGAATDVVALVSDSGEFRIIDPVGDSQFVASLSFADNSLNPQLVAYAAPGSVFPDSSVVCSGSLSGSVQPGAAITGNYGCGGDHGTFSLLYDTGASLQAPSDRFPVIGARGEIRPGDLLFIAVQRDGSVTGSDSAGCSYTGQMAVIDPFINVYSMTANQTCGSQTLILTGLTTFGFVQNTSTQVVYLGMSDGMHSIAGLLLFQ